MKRSFYQMLGVEPNADRAQIDAAFEKAMTSLHSTTSMRGRAEMVELMNLLREGHRILSDPQRRAKHDADLLKADTGVEIMSAPEYAATTRNQGVALAILLALTAVFAGVVYSQMAHKIDQVRIEHQQAFERQREQQNRPIVVDMPTDAPDKKEVDKIKVQ